MMALPLEPTASTTPTADKAKAAELKEHVSALVWIADKARRAIDEPPPTPAPPPPTSCPSDTYRGIAESAYQLGWIDCRTQLITTLRSLILKAPELRATAERITIEIANLAPTPGGPLP